MLKNKRYSLEYYFKIEQRTNIFVKGLEMKILFWDYDFRVWSMEYSNADMFCDANESLKSAALDIRMIPV